MKYAIIQSGGNQYRCEEGATLEIQRISAEAGSTHAFQEVLLIYDGADIKVGTPHVAGAQVTAEVIGEVKGEKTYSFRYKAKERQRSRRGHRQIYTQLKIAKIEG
jgi:large subunit ribosomal protein L21